MKKIIFLIAAAALMASCSTKQDSGDKSSVASVETNKPVVSAVDSGLPKFDQSTSFQDVIKELGQPTKTVKFAHTNRYYYKNKNICVYLDGSGMVLGVEKGECSEGEDYDSKFY